MQLQEKSSAEIAREYISEHPSIIDCLSYDIVNFSALARKIMDETGARNEEAVMVACRRYQQEMAGRRAREASIISTVKNSRVMTKSKVSIISAKNEPRALQALQRIQSNALARNNSMFTVQQGSKVLTIILGEEMVEETVSILGRDLVIGTRNRLSEITIQSPESIVETPGVLVRFSSALAEIGVNCLEVVSCNTETTFVVPESDLMRAYNLLSRLVS
ncbi:MAG: ACT domain-containing protein [Thermoplasmata archaeon]|uniref:ACT domain-containing protein n=1 Tax=Candidatus Sysuiplasma superficiale TaxID=2823368 RepID=A0A8J7YN35_9ARCH|nr:ACT domain-containing protein [Candidatus Sysuiplasma superficiale]MBX8643804.1 ACT domain-containing protein [Candidatus Sysuiplasma superficiale]